MNKTCKSLALLVLASALAVPGCNSNPVGRVPFQVPVVAYTDDGQYLPDRVGPGLVAMEGSPIPDVPMPIGFKPVFSKCSSSFDGVSRSVTHYYQGRARAAELVLFYRQQLPYYGWELLDKQINEDGTSSIHYTKGAEALAMRLSDRFNTGTVEVYISPR